MSLQTTLALPSKEEGRAFLLHLIFSLMEGLVGGILSLNEFVYSQGLKASQIQVGVLIQLGTVALIFSIFFMEFSEKVVNKKRWLRNLAICTRMPLILFLFFPAHIQTLRGNPYYQYIFLSIFFLYFMAPPFLSPVINQLLKDSYGPEKMGRLYGHATALNTILTLVSSYFFGRLLDLKESSFVYLYPMMGVLGVISIFILTQIPYKAPESTSPAWEGSFWKKISSPVKKTFYIFKGNTPYFHFEMAFMAYGFSFLMSVVVVVLLLTQVLQLSYTDIAIYKGIPLVVSIFLFSYFGSILDKMDPRRFAQITYSCMIGYITFLLVVYYFPWSTHLGSFKLYYFLFLAYFFLGLFSATMTLLWNIGSMYFCTSRETAYYQSIHVSLTGVRGLVAPLLGVGIYKFFGFAGTFLSCLFCLFMAILLLEYSLRKYSLVRRS